ncbi:CatB-related O-acetyltransferase [Priestia megaterium]|uniref:CatB-related O-acetyltransferase n=1 Tax=Priestia megaterium TaxID=1404 RepID=UPI001E4F3204|nr:CatB-related O-acetyltransferase [Priestia megaterium]MCE4089469.1 CatB-related O-acetyltransferase [Priestia megaterium]
MQRILKFLNGIVKKNDKISILTFIDKNCLISTNSAITRFCKLRKVQLGDYSYIGVNSNISNCEIGRYCSIGPSVKIGLGKHPIDLLSTSPIFYNPKNILNISLTEELQYQEYENTIIKNDVWIGANAIILDGIKIGNGAIIAAGAVVTKDVPDYAIVAGVPAKVIKLRFSEDIVQELLRTQWWKREPEEFKKDIKYFDNIQKILKRLRDES